MDINRNWACTCKLCNKRFQKLNAMRSRCHLLKINGKGVAVCSKITDAQRRLLPGGAVVTTQAHVDNLFAPTIASDADKAIASWVFENGIAFNTLQSPAFKEMCTAVARAGPGFEPPKRTKMSTTLLASAVADVKAGVQPIFDCAQNYGCALCVDGYTDGAQRKLTAYVMTTPIGNCVVGCDFGGAETQTAVHVANGLVEQINKLGEDVVDCIVMDNAQVRIFQTSIGLRVVCFVSSRSKTCVIQGNSNTNGVTIYVLI